LFATFSDYLREKIEGSPEWKNRSAVAYTGGGVADVDDDIPF